MDILFCDFLLERGNVNVDARMIDLLAEEHNVVCSLPKSWYPCDFKNEDKILFLDLIKTNNSKNAIVYKLQTLKRMRIISKLAKEYIPDLILVSTYETRIMPIGLRFFKKNRKKIIVIENNNIDLLANKVHRFCYNIIKNKVFHIVYENYIKDHLITELGIDKGRVCCVPHVMYKQEKHSFRSLLSNFDCIAISSSTDEEFIKSMIDFETENKFFKNNNIKILIKSSRYQFDDDFLRVINKMIPKEEYDYYYSSCKIVIAYFSNDYNYRMSGTIVDAFSNEKIIISNNFSLANYYSQKYEGSIIVANSIDDLALKIVRLVRTPLKNERYKDFYNDHSPLLVKRRLNIALNQFESFKNDSNKHA